MSAKSRRPGKATKAKSAKPGKATRAKPAKAAKAKPVKAKAPKRKLNAKRAPAPKPKKPAKRQSAKAVAPAPKTTKAKAATKAVTNAMQRDHMQEQTEVLLVHGWPAHVVFPGSSASEKLAALTAALAGTDDVFVVAQDLVYCDGRMETVFGRAALRVHADAGPVELPADKVRAIEADAKPLSAETRKKLEGLTDAPIPQGPPAWYLVPTGCLATGYMAFGEVVGRDKDLQAEPGAEIIYGCDMRQDGHKKAVMGEWVGNATDWTVLPVDLSKATDVARRARRPKGRYYVMGRYD